MKSNPSWQICHILQAAKRTTGAMAFILIACCTSSARGEIINGDFEGYSNASAAADIAVSDATPTSWLETGVGGHTLIGDQFGDFTARSDPDGLDDFDPTTPYAAWLTEFDEGIFQSFSTSTGVFYGVDFIFGQFAPEVIPRIQFKAYNGPGIGGDLLNEFFVDADADIYGDGDVTGAYVGGFVAMGPMSTILFTLGENSTSKTEGVGVDNVDLFVIEVPEPGQTLLVLQGTLTVVLLVFRRRWATG